MREYTSDDPARRGHGERQRLITALLDPDHYPALILATEYHQRWEVETTIAEVKAQQADRRLAPPVRRRRPRAGVPEVSGVLLAHRAVRLTRYQAATVAGLDPDRLRCGGTLRILRRAGARFQRGGAGPGHLPFVSRGC